MVFHHTSPDAWRFKTVTKIRAEDTYLTTAIDGSSAVVIRFINHDSENNAYKENEIVIAQVVGFVLSGDIYDNEEEFKKDNRDNALYIKDNSIFFRGVS